MQTRVISTYIAAMRKTEMLMLIYISQRHLKQIKRESIVNNER